MTILISRTDLARNTRKVIEQARRGEPVLIESYGEEQVAILDAVDYRLLRAAVRHLYRSEVPINHPEATSAGLTEADLEAWVALVGGGAQAKWDRVIGTYLDGDISLGRAAELLNMSRFELQPRLHRLGIPIHLGSRTVEEARSEYEVLKKYLES